MAQPAGRNRRSRATRPRRVGEALDVVKGLDVFQNHFARYADQYVLIGGTAATLAMEEVGHEFRATKDLDIALHIEALNSTTDGSANPAELIAKLQAIRRRTPL